jgi:GTP-binding protein EngB required for normal cell division
MHATKSSEDGTRIESARQGVLAAVDSLTRKAAQFGLPAPPEALEIYKQKLQQNEFTILVAGEAKRGKSSFINALIGRSILPTDVDIATSQVFRIRRAAREAYHLRFEDGSSQEITASDLTRYGSQVFADARQAPQLHQIIRWIEADLPIRFLPEGVNLLDTPGLGTLYAAHSQITHRFVPQADAVIFVLDSAHPILQTEVEFVKTILGVTRNIFFIQTKIDQHRQDTWRTIQVRNEEILKHHFGDKLEDIRVWPICSKHLLKANQDDDEGYLLLSKAKELWLGLQAFLFQVVGWSRLAETLSVVDQHYSVSYATLAGRLAALSTESKQEREEMSHTLLERKTRFEDEWGHQGDKRLKLIQKVQQTTTIGRNAFLQAIAPAGAIERAFREKIEKTETEGQIKKLNDTLSEEIVADSFRFWREVTDWVQQQLTVTLSEFLEEAETLTLPVAGEPGELLLKKNILDQLEQDWYSKFRSSYGDAVFMSGIASSLTTLAGGVGLIAASAVAPLAIVVGAAAWLYGAFEGQRKAIVSRITRSKDELQRDVADIMQHVRNHFTSIDLTTRQQSLVDFYFTAIQEQVMGHVERVAARKNSELRAETQRQLDVARMNDVTRKAKAEETRKQIEAISAIGKNIKALTREVNSLARRSPAEATEATQVE